MNNRKKIIILILVLTFCISACSLFFLPNEFYLRFNLASKFHLAHKYELFIVPISSVLIFYFFEYIRSFYERKNDLTRVRITEIATIFIVLLGFIVNAIFIFEAFTY